MDQVLSAFSLGHIALACAIAGFAGIVKGLVGFGMPLLLISGLSMFLPPEIALSGLIFPTLVTNGLQALRHGVAAAKSSVKKFRVFLLVGLVFLLASAQLVRFLPGNVFLLMLGLPVTFFAAIQLFGLRFSIEKNTVAIEATVAAFVGFVGGISGVWGPPTVTYLTAMNTPKKEQLRIQGVIYGLGAVALVVAHLGSGVLNANTWALSLVLVVPAVAGMWVGARLNDRIDQETFRKATLVVLLLAGLNLLRRALFA